MAFNKKPIEKYIDKEQDSDKPQFQSKFFAFFHTNIF